MSSTIDNSQCLRDAPAPPPAVAEPGRRHHRSTAAREQVDGQVLVLPDSDDAVRLARSWLTRDVVGMPSDLAEHTILLATELVSNAVQHGRPEVQISVHVTPPSVHVAVADHADTMPVFPDESQALGRRSGRGLSLVASLATGWGFHHHYPGPGKTVWFTLYGLNHST